jgi:hypothetical protein
MKPIGESVAIANELFTSVTKFLNDKGFNVTENEVIKRSGEALEDLLSYAEVTTEYKLKGKE